MRIAAWACVGFACLLVPIPPPPDGVDLLWRLGAVAVLIVLTLIHPLLTIGVSAPIVIVTALTFNPFWYPTLQLEIVNRTDHELIVDGTSLRLAPPDLESKMWGTAVAQEPVMRLKSSADNPLAYGHGKLFHIWLKRWDKAVELRIAVMPEDREAVHRVPMRFDRNPVNCRIVLRIFDDHIERSGCEPPEIYIPEYQEPPRWPFV
jgi:hypothetical protein